MGSTAAGRALVSWKSAIKALFILLRCAALERVQMMTPIATNRTATQTAPNTTDMVRMSVIISSLDESADSMARRNVLRIGRSSEGIIYNYYICTYWYVSYLLIKIPSVIFIVLLSVIGYLLSNDCDHSVPTALSKSQSSSRRRWTTFCCLLFLRSFRSN